MLLRDQKNAVISRQKKVYENFFFIFLRSKGILSELLCKVEKYYKNKVLKESRNFGGNTTIYGYKILWNNTIYGNGLKTLFSQKELTVITFYNKY